MWEIFERFYRVFRVVLGSFGGRGDIKWEDWFWELVNLLWVYFFIEILGLENIKIKFFRRNSCFVLKYLFYFVIILYICCLYFIIIRYLLFINYRYFIFINLLTLIINMNIN